MNTKWDRESIGFKDRGYLSSADILDSVRDTGKVLVPSGDFIFPSERSMEEMQKFDRLIGKDLPLIQEALTPEEANRYIDYLKRKHNIRKGTLEAVSNATWDMAETYEPKMYQALSEGIRDVYGFKPHHKIQDISKELASSMGVPNVPIEFKYMDDVAGSTNGSRIRINPQHLNLFGREALLGHELRHIKENMESGPSIGRINTSNPLIALRDTLAQPALYKSKQGKDLQQFVKGGNFKDKMDALDIVSFFEGKHFKNPYIKENLKRVTKNLPIVGTAATVAGGLGYSDISGAATDVVIPGGLQETGIADERAISDPRYQEYIRKMQAKGKK
jgi:hypothetical protein